MTQVDRMSDQPAWVTRAGRWCCRWKVLIVISAVLYVWWSITGFSANVLVQGDELVYRAAATSWFNGRPVYGTRLELELPGAGEMFFTYTPVGLVVLSPLALVPLSTSAIMLSLACNLALWGTLALWVRALAGRNEGLPWLALALSVVVAATAPVRDHLAYGQVNILLLALASLDLLPGKRPWPRGLLLGIAIAIKLTPAALLLYPLLSRRWRVLATSILTAAVLSATSWLIVPREATYYWFTAMRDPGRVGNIRNPANQSLRGLVWRFLDGTIGGALWLGLCIIVIAWVTFVAFRRLLPEGEHPGALALCMTLPVLLSPIAWTHHWVWFIPLLGWLAVRGSTTLRLTAAAGFLVLTLYPITLIPANRLIPRTEDYSPVLAAVTPGYVYWALVALAVAGTAQWLPLSRRISV